MLYIRRKTLETMVGHVSDVIRTLEDESGCLVNMAEVETHRLEAGFRALITALTGENVQPDDTKEVSLKGIAEARKGGSY